MSIKAFEITSLPASIPYLEMVKSALGRQFMVIHSFSESKTYIATEEDGVAETMKRVVHGIELAGPLRLCDLRKAKMLVPYFGRGHSQILEGIYGMLRGCDARIVVSFAPAEKGYIERMRERAENAMSSEGVRLTKSLGGRPGSYTGSIQMDLYYGSTEKRIVESLLGMLNDALLSGGAAYRIAIIIEAGTEECLDAASNAMRSRMLVLEEHEMHSMGIDSLFSHMKSAGAIPFNYALASRMLAFSDRIMRVPVVPTERQFSKNGNIMLGHFLEEGIGSTGEAIMTDMHLFNLGTLITGLPGYGKTFAAMSLVGQLAVARMPILIISPTEEWQDFAYANGMRVIRLYDSATPINFFACPEGINTERFYENLAMLIASASNAGPYRNSIEKCLLAAFHRSYAKTRTPDPVYVYDEIEYAIIEQHGKKTNTGVKYTKHGENVKAALESLRLMLSRPEFAATNGIDFRSLIRNGTVFDMSNVSNNMKPFFYALILNQAYSMADSLDSKGDNELRMLICIEEAQLAFGDPLSAATADLKQRIQDFRKRGVGLMLITHSITDIDANIRRLCQTKLYFRQSADIAKLALSDLAFGEDESALNSIKKLGQRKCALSYVGTVNGEKRSFGPVFAEIPEFKFIATTPQVRSDEIRAPQLISCTITIGSDARDISAADVELFYTGEMIAKGTLSKGTITFGKLIEGKKYTLLVHGEKRKDNLELDFHAEPQVALRL